MLMSMGNVNIHVKIQAKLDFSLQKIQKKNSFSKVKISVNIHRILQER